MSDTQEMVTKKIYIKEKNDDESLKTNPKRTTLKQGLSLDPAMLSMTLSLEDMARPTHREVQSAFIKYAEENRSDENVKFFYDLRALEKDLMAEQAKQGLPLETIEQQKAFQEKFRTIYETYIPESARLQQINLSASNRTILTEENSKFFTLKSFKLASAEIETLIGPEILKPFHKKQTSSVSAYDMTTQLSIKETARATPFGTPNLLPMAAIAKEEPLFDFEKLSFVLEQLRIYLAPITKKEKEERNSRCICFIACRNTDKQRFHSSLRALKKELALAFEYWHNHYIDTLESKISTIFQNYQRFFKKEDDTLLASLNEALILLQEGKKKQGSTPRSEVG